MNPAIPLVLGGGALLALYLAEKAKHSAVPALPGGKKIAGTPGVPPPGMNLQQWKDWNWNSYQNVLATDPTADKGMTRDATDQWSEQNYAGYLSSAAVGPMNGDRPLLQGDVPSHPAFSGEPYDDFQIMQSVAAQLASQLASHPPPNVHAPVAPWNQTINNFYQAPPVRRGPVPSTGGPVRHQNPWNLPTPRLPDPSNENWDALADQINEGTEDDDIPQYGTLFGT